MREPKKTETVEVRIPFETKHAFMQRCRDRGLTVSESIRRHIDTELQKSAHPCSKRWIIRRRLIATILAILSVGALAAPSLAQSLTPSRAVFDQLDRDKDGALSFEEFRAR